MSAAQSAANSAPARPSRAVKLQRSLRRLVLAASLLIIYGMIAVYSTTVYLRIAQGRPPYTDFIKHLAFIGIGLLAAGLVVLLGTLFQPVRRWLKYLIPFAFIISLGLVAMVRFSPFGVSVMGATRGLDIGLITFQPSELLKITTVLYLAQLLCWWRKPRPDDPGEESQKAAQDEPVPWREQLRSFKLKRDGRPVWPELPKRCFTIMLFACGLTVIQPDLGSTGIILGAGIITILIAGVNLKHLARAVLIFAVLCTLVLLAAPDKFSYAFKRIDTWQAGLLGPVPDEDNAGYQITQARGALVEGGLYGRGFLKSYQKRNRLPLSTKDFVFPIIVEELGYIGGVVLILLFFNLAWAGVRLSRYCRDPFNRTVIASLGFTLCLQGFVNVGTTIGTLPLSGLTLPFFSVGGTSLVVSIVTISIMLSLGLSEYRAASDGSLRATGRGSGQRSRAS